MKSLFVLKEFSEWNAGNVVLLALEQNRGLVSCLLIKPVAYVNQH